MVGYDFIMFLGCNIRITKIRINNNSTLLCYILIFKESIDFRSNNNDIKQYSNRMGMERWEVNVDSIYNVYNRIYNENIYEMNYSSYYL